MFSKAAVIAVLFAVTLCGRVLGQETILPLPLETISPTEAVAKAKKEHRVLIVVHKWKRPPFNRRPWWASDTMRGWLKWHGMLVEFEPGSPNAKEYLAKFPPTASRHTYGFDIIVDGQPVESLAMPPAGIPNAKDSNDWGDSMGLGLSATYVLFQLDFMLERMQATKPVWSVGHERDCPEPKRPAREYLYNQSKDDLPPVDNLDTPAAGERYVDVMARLNEADALAAGGDNRRAIALLSWLWERGGQADPGFLLARVGLVLPRMVKIKKTEAAAGKRMLDLAATDLALYPWYDDSEELSYLALRYGNGEGGLVVSRFITELIDIDEETMGGLVTARLGDMKAQLAERSNDRVISSKDWRKLAQLAGTHMPKGSYAPVKERWARQRVEVLTVGGLRTYAALLASDDPAERERAASLADDVLKLAADAPPLVRADALRAFVFAAASVGRAGPEHAAWLSQAAALEQSTGAAPKANADERVRPSGADPLMRYIGTRPK